MSSLSTILMHYLERKILRFLLKQEDSTTDMYPIIHEETEKSEVKKTTEACQRLADDNLIEFDGENARLKDVKAAKRKLRFTRVVDFLWDLFIMGT